MNKGMKKAKNHIMKQKKTYLFLITLVLITLLSGIFFWFMINSEDKQLVTSELTNFFSCIKKGDSIDYLGSLINSVVTNLVYILLIWLLGISIIGLPLILIIISIKSFIVGFSISSIIASFGFKGILGVLTYVFPHQIIFLMLLILLGFYSCSFCIKLFRYLFLKQMINFKNAMRKYFKILALSSAIAVLLSLFETFVSTYLMKLFTFII